MHNCILITSILFKIFFGTLLISFIIETICFQGCPFTYGIKDKKGQVHFFFGLKELRDRTRMKLSKFFEVKIQGRKRFLILQFFLFTV